MKMNFDAPKNFFKKTFLGGQPKSSINEGDFQKFLDTGEVSDEIIEKIKNKKARDPKEEAIYQAYTERFKGPEPAPQPQDNTQGSVTPDADDPETPKDQEDGEINQTSNPEDKTESSIEEKAEKEVGDFISKFGLENSLPTEFGNMSVGQKLKIVRGLEQRVVDIVKEGSQTVYSDMLREKMRDALTPRANENELFGKAMKILRSAKVSIVEGVKKQHTLKKAEKDFLDGLKNTDEGKNLIKENLGMLTKHFGDKEIALDEKGNPFTQYITEQEVENWSEDEVAWSNYFDTTANNFQNIPYEWSQGTTAQKKIYEKAKKEYDEAKNEILKIKAEKGGDDGKAMLEVSAIDNSVQMEQILNTHPEFQKALQDFEKDPTKMDSAKRTFFSFLQNRFGSKVGLTHLGLSGIGYGARVAAKGAAIATSATGLTFLAAPIIGGAIGYWRGKMRGEKILDTRSKEARHGKKDTSKEARNVEDVENLAKRLEVLTKSLEKASSEEEKTAKLDQIKRRIEYTQGKIESGLVDFGNAKKVLTNQLKLVESLNTAINSSISLESTVREDIDERLKQFLSYQKGSIDEAQKTFIKAQAKQGMKIGAGFATVFYGIRWLQEHMGEPAVAEDKIPGSPKITAEVKSPVPETPSTATPATAAVLEKNGDKFVSDTSDWAAKTLKVNTEAIAKELEQEGIINGDEEINTTNERIIEATYTKVTSGDGITQTLKKILESDNAPEWFKKAMGENPAPADWKKMAEQLGVFKGDQAEDSLKITSQDEIGVNDSGEIILKRNGEDIVLGKYEGNEFKANDWEKEMSDKKFIDTDKKVAPEKNEASNDDTQKITDEQESKTTKPTQNPTIEFKEVKTTPLVEHEPAKSAEELQKEITNKRPNPSYETKGTYNLGEEKISTKLPVINEKFINTTYSDQFLKEALEKYPGEWQLSYQKLVNEFSAERMLEINPATDFEDKFTGPASTLKASLLELQKISGLKPLGEDVLGVGKAETCEDYIKRVIKWGAENNKLEQVKNAATPDTTSMQETITSEAPKPAATETPKTESPKHTDFSKALEKNETIKLGNDNFEIRPAGVAKGMPPTLIDGIKSEEIWYNGEKLELEWGPTWVDGRPNFRFDVEKLSLDPNDSNILIVEGRGEELGTVVVNGKEDVGLITEKVKIFLRKNPYGGYNQFNWERVPGNIPRPLSDAEKLANEVATLLENPQGVIVSTPKVKWAEDAFEQARDEIKYIKTPADARAYEIRLGKLFTQKIGILAEGEDKKANYSLEEYRTLLAYAKEMQNYFGEIDEKYGTNREGSLDNVVKVLTNRSSYAGYNQYKELENL